MDLFLKTYRKAIDFYIDKSIISDLLISLTIVLSLLKLNSKYLCFEQNKLILILDKINNHSITLTGFILACLTIIISIKASTTKEKSTDNSSNIEILFNSTHYKTIVSVFFKAMFVYGLIHITTHVLTSYYNILNFELLTYSIIVLSIVTYSILLRCFLVLWLVIKHETEK